MNKKIDIGAAGGCVVAACIAAIAKKNESGAKPNIWDKMRGCMAEMPEDFPPRMMFENVEVISSA